MKTVLVPGAPWPKVEPFIPTKRPARHSRKKQAETDDNFARWKKKQEKIDRENQYLNFLEKIDAKKGKK
jgi:hypothetical protein